MDAIITQKELRWLLKRRLPGVQFGEFTPQGVKVKVEMSNLNKQEVVQGQQIMRERRGRFVIVTRNNQYELVFQ